MAHIKNIILNNNLGGGAFCVYVCVCVCVCVVVVVWEFDVFVIRCLSQSLFFCTVSVTDRKQF